MLRLVICLTVLRSVVICSGGVILLHSTEIVLIDNINISLRDVFHAYIICVCFMISPPEGCPSVLRLLPLVDF